MAPGKLIVPEKLIVPGRLNIAPQQLITLGRILASGRLIRPWRLVVPSALRRPRGPPQNLSLYTALRERSHRIRSWRPIAEEPFRIYCKY